MNNAPQEGLCAIFQAMACSLPPEPINRIFTITRLKTQISEKESNRNSNRFDFSWDFLKRELSVIAVLVAGYYLPKRHEDSKLNLYSLAEMKNRIFLYKNRTVLYLHLLVFLQIC